MRFISLCAIVFVSSLYSVDIPTNQKLFENKAILILGGTGYLGRAVATEVLKYDPRKVIIFSRDEVKHFQTRSFFNNDARIYNVIGDIRDYDSLLSITKSVDIVFHIAALKRMDALESNVAEAIKTNVLGSLNVFNACVANEVNKVLFISTDKSCLPVNTYGACKFISEKIFTNYDKNIKTKFMATRFGNILESTGSVIPIFTEKIKMGEAIPLTDAAMTRFIIDKNEAIEMIFDVLRYGTGGEIFVKRLPAFKITTLIEILKDKFNADNKIEIIGIRPGEKIHEVLINESEVHRTFKFKDYFIIKSSVTNSYDLETEAATRNNLLDKQMSHYSSDQEVLSRGALFDHFKKLGLL